METHATKDANIWYNVGDGFECKEGELCQRKLPVIN